MTSSARDASWAAISPSGSSSTEPVNLVFCSRHGERYRLRLERFSEAPRWSRAERSAMVASLAQRFAHRLAEECRQVPLQWFNFYDFWAQGDDRGNA